MAERDFDDPADAIKAHLFAGRKIAAIKEYRQISGAGLKEAKDFIEALEEELRGSSPELFSAPPGNKGCGATVLCLLVVLGALLALA